MLDLAIKRERKDGRIGAVSTSSSAAETEVGGICNVRSASHPHKKALTEPCIGGLAPILNEFDCELEREGPAIAFWVNDNEALDISGTAISDR